MKNEDGKTLSNTQRAVRDLRQMILSGELAAGTDHLETELAEHLGMSRTPVREAALMLESKGLLEMRPRKGVRILPVSPDDMREIYDILTELESLAAERAAEFGHSEQDLKPLAQSIAQMDRAIAAADLESWAEADDLFHQELVRLGGNRRVESIVSMMSDQVRGRVHRHCSSALCRSSQMKTTVLSIPLSVMASRTWHGNGIASTVCMPSP